MRKFYLALAAVASIGLASCSAIDKVTSSNVPAMTIFVAANAFNVVKTAATGYIVYCTPNPTPKGCNDEVIQEKIIPTIDKGTDARNELVEFAKAHPGELGDKGLYDALVTSTSTLKTLLATYDKRA